MGDFPEFAQCYVSAKIGCWPKLGEGQRWVTSKGRGNALDNAQCNGRENVWRDLERIEGGHLREQGTHGERTASG